MVSCFDACFGNGSDNHVGYAYFAPTIIKTYGYGSTFCSTYLGFFAENLTLSQNSKRNCFQFHHGQPHFAFPCSSHLFPID